MSGASSSGAREVKNDEEGENKKAEEFESRWQELKEEDDKDTVEFLSGCGLPVTDISMILSLPETGITKILTPDRPHSPGRTRSRSPVRVRDSDMHDILDLAKSFQFDKAIAEVRILSRSPHQEKQLVNMTPSGRWTILHQAAYAGSTKAIDEKEALTAMAILLSMGADASLAAGIDGKTPKDWTQEADTPPAMQTHQEHLLIVLQTADLARFQQNQIGRICVLEKVTTRSSTRRRFKTQLTEHVPVHSS